MPLILKLVFASLVLASSPAWGRSSGNLTFEARSHDFGEVYRGSQLVHRFKFVNTGSGPIHIQGVHAACGCTAVEVDKGRKYMPGDAGFVEVKLDTTDFAGSLVKTVTVMTSERLLPDRTLTLRAQIKSEVEAVPPLADLGEVPAKTGGTATLAIKPIGSFRLVPGELVYNTELIDARLVADGAAHKLLVMLKPGVKPGFIKETVILRTNSSHMPELAIPVRASVKGAVDVAPAYLEFGAVAPRENVKRSLTLKSVGDVKITGTRAELNVNGKKIENAERFLKIETVSYEKEKRLVAIELINIANLAGSVHGKLFLTTSDADQKEVAVDFYAFFR